METDAACEVSILGGRASTFCVEGHHYALVLIGDLEPGTVTPYEVRLGGERVWPPDDGRPASAIVTRQHERQAELRRASSMVTIYLQPGSMRIRRPRQGQHRLNTRGRNSPNRRAAQTPHKVAWPNRAETPCEASWVRWRRSEERRVGKECRL